MFRIALFLALLLPVCCSVAADAPAHHGDRVFTNPYSEPRRSGFFSVVRSMLFSGEWQRHDPETDIVDTTSPAPATPADTDPVVTTGEPGLATCGEERCRQDPPGDDVSPSRWRGVYGARRDCPPPRVLAVPPG